VYFFLPPYLSFTLLLYGFLQRRVEEWEKVRQTGDFWEFWHTKADGFTAIGKSMPVHVFWCTVVCSITWQMWSLKKTKCVTSSWAWPNNKYKREREREREHQHRNHGRRRPWPLASPMPRPHVFRLDKFIRNILGNAVCAWFGRKWVGTSWERTLYNQARAK